MPDDDPSPVLGLRPIGVVRSPFNERIEAPRQPRVEGAADGSIELFPMNGIEHALEDLASFRYIWVVFWFHKNVGFHPKVRPPRSRTSRGVFATRSPYRPNPIGLSAVELDRVEGRVLYVRDMDMLDGTPVLDIKPYVPYVDSIADATNGWLDNAERPPDPLPSYEVSFSERALRALEYLEQRHAIALRTNLEKALKLGPSPHPYRRIKRAGDGFVLAHKTWRCEFEASERRIFVTAVRSGYRPSELFGSNDPELAAHRDFVERFGR